MTYAKTFFELFAPHKRTDGGRYFALTTNAPEWAREIMRIVHSGGAPDDWTYWVAYNSALELMRDPDTDEYEFAGRMADVYTYARAMWLATALNAEEYCAEAAELNQWEGRGVSDMIGDGQEYGAALIFNLVKDNLSLLQNEAAA
jgi:hypothetical protein